MTALQNFYENVFFGEETFDHERSICLVDIMNAMGFSKFERKIHRHHVHLRNAHTSDKYAFAITGSPSDGMCSGIYSDQSHHDHDVLITAKKIKLYTPRTNNINNPPLLLLHDNEDYTASCFVEEDDNFPGYVKLSLAEVKTKYSKLVLSTKMKDDKLYLSNSMKNGFNIRPTL